MPIFSSNRVYGAGNGNTVVAAEGYTENDFGRILTECAINDMRLFNAAIAQDFKEAQAMNEGTMVASEIQAFQEASVKEAWKGIIAKLKKLWEKIKGVFKNVYAKLSLWLNRNTKAYIAQHKKALLNKDLKACPIPKYAPHSDLTTIDGYDNIKIPEIKKIVDIVKGQKIFAAGYDPDYSGPDYAEKLSADDIYNKMVEGYFRKPDEKRTFGDLNGEGVTLDSIFKNLSGSSDYLKALSKMSKSADRIFSQIVKSAEKRAKEFDKAGDSENSTGYSEASKRVSRMQSQITAVTSAVIRVLKKGISEDRALIATLVAYNPAKTESAMLEFAYATGFDALHEETEGETMEDIEAAAKEEGINIDITVSGDVDADVTVNDETDDAPAADEPDAE